MADVARFIATAALIELPRCGPAIGSRRPGPDGELPPVAGVSSESGDGGAECVAQARSVVHATTTGATPARVRSRTWAA